jgi:hypothetical protein
MGSQLGKEGIYYFGIQKQLKIWPKWCATSFYSINKVVDREDCEKECGIGKCSPPSVKRRTGARHTHYWRLYGRRHLAT